MVSGASGKQRGLPPLPRTRICVSDSSRSSRFSASTSHERRPSKSIRPTMAKSREVRKLAQKCATSSTDNGTMTRCGVFTRKRLKAEDERSLCVGEGEPQRTFSDTDSAVDAGRGGLGLLIGLEANVVEQGGFRECSLRDRR